MEIVIVGSGFAGLCMGIRLKQAGIEDFVILEKDDQFGGTWRVNDYPGAACDVPSHLYSFSFAQNAEWSRRFPTQPEIWEYTRKVARDFGLISHIRLSCALRGARYDEASVEWALDTAKGPMRAKMLILAQGGLGTPSVPALPGLENFAGKVFHSSRWDHGFDLAGKRIAVIGTGASAVQFVPEIAGKVSKLDLYQRTPPWILPRPDRAMTAPERWLLRHVKPLQWLYRGLTYMRFEWRYLAFSSMPWLRTVIRQKALRHLRRQIPHDAELRRKLTPDYAIGCKRILLVNDYYPTLTRSHVELITGGIGEITRDGIRDKAGNFRPADAIIFGTGFDVAQTMTGAPIIGRDGGKLGEGELEAYKGAAIAGFPNLFMITGPNTATGHNSIIYMIESGVTYVLEAIRTLRRERLASLEITAEAQTSFNQELQSRLRRTVWNSGCKSWYLSASGRNYTLWPGFTFQYRRVTKRFDSANYIRG